MGKGKKGKKQTDQSQVGHGGQGGQGSQPPSTGAQSQRPPPVQPTQKGAGSQEPPPGSQSQGRALAQPQSSQRQGPSSAQLPKSALGQQGVELAQKPSSHSGKQPDKIQGAQQKGPKGPGGSGGPSGPSAQTGPPPQGTPSSQLQKDARGQQQGGPPQKSASPQGAPDPSRQPQKSSQGAPQPQKKGPQGQPQKKGPQGGQPPTDKKSAPTTMTPQSGGNQSKREAAGQQAPRKQVDKENEPPKKMEQKPSQPSKDAVKKPPQQKQVEVFPIPFRKAPGFSGTKITVDVNQLPLNLSNICPLIYHYDMLIVPDKPKRLLRSVEDEFAKKHYPDCKPAFDGRRNVYSYKLLPFGTFKRDKVIVENKERIVNNKLEFSVEMKLTQSMETNAIHKYLTGQDREFPMAVIQAIDIVLRAAPIRGVSVPVGRNYFLPPTENSREAGQVVSLGGGLELWHGFYQSAILNWKPFLNIDVAHKGFPKPINLTEILKEVCNLRDLSQPLNAGALRRFQSFITTLKIDYEGPNANAKKTYRVNGLGESAEQYTFRPEENGPEMNVVEYFWSKYKYKLRYPWLPTIQVDPADKNIFFPIELCTMRKGQTLIRKLDENQTNAMVKSAAQGPESRKNKILAAIKQAKYNTSPVVKAFGIEVVESMERVPARVLVPPTVEYGNDKSLSTGSGAWRAKKFLVSKSLSTWFILDLDYTRREKLENFVRLCMDQGYLLGMNIKKPSEIVTLDVTLRYDIKNHIVKCLEDWKEQGAELVVVIMPEPKYGDFYCMVKQCAELTVGILTQCIKSNTMTRMNPATCGNLLLKINSKINGVNHSLSGNFRPTVLKRPVMLVGMDVTHPSPDRSDIPSIAAVAASFDPKAFRYNMIWRFQDPTQEIIVDLKNIMIEQLQYFYNKTNGLKPEKILVFRDGVSESFFQKILKCELMAIREACMRMADNYKPGITFLVVQKRHHIRFFPTSSEHADVKTNNVKPGTIVDTQITHPRELDFYLVSHASLQGTARPTKYHRLWDDNNISEDDLEVLTYYLCYLFSRCTRSVSYPAPTYYAHLAAFRARAYLDNNAQHLDDLPRYAARNQINADFLKNSPMFFV